MSSVHIEWGNLGRSEAIERDIKVKSKKIFTMSPSATKLIVYLQIINPINGTGVPTQKVSMELRLPQNQDIRAENEGSDLYKCLRESKRALLAQITNRKKNHYKRITDFIPDKQPIDELTADELDFAPT